MGSRDLAPPMTDPMPPGAPVAQGTRASIALTVDNVYERHFDFVWRNARRMGVPDAALDDAVQDVFLVVHRRLSEFEGRSQIETWLFGILLRVVKDQRRAQARRTARQVEAEAISRQMDGVGRDGPHDLLARHEAVRALYAMLDELDEDKRAIFVAVDLEQLPVTEAADAMGWNLNTAYARLRAGRRDFEQILVRKHALEGRVPS